MVNAPIRNEIAKNRIKMYEIAEKFGISDSAFSKKLRKELSEEEKSKIRQAIQEIKEESNYVQNANGQTSDNGNTRK